MKRIFTLAFLALITSSCCHKGPHASWTYDSVVYEMNIRNYTPEEGFASAQKQLPRLKELGVDVIWPYSDYASWDVDDFDSFLGTAHKLGLKVILDCMPELDSSSCSQSSDMYESVRNSMLYWLDRGVDGFHCGRSYLGSQDFWAETIHELRCTYRRGLYFLAEGEEPWMHAAGFDASYAWRCHDMLNDIASGRAAVEDIRDYVTDDAQRFPPEAFRLMFTSIHEGDKCVEGEYGGMGKVERLMSVLAFSLPQSQPLIHSLPCCIPTDEYDFFKTIIGIRHAHPALRSGEHGGDFSLLEDQWVPDDVFAFVRRCPREELMVLENFSDRYTEVALPDAETWEDAISGELFDEELNCPVLAPWEYRIFIRK